MAEETIIIDDDNSSTAAAEKVAADAEATKQGETKTGESSRQQADDDQTTEEDEVEALAKEMGWKPKENFGGDESDFVDAKSFIRKGQDIQDSMRKSLKNQKRQLSDMSSNIVELKQHNERAYKAEVANLKKELTSLAAQKKEAIADGDVEKVSEIDEQIDTVKESIAEPGPKSKEIQSDNPEFDEWEKENPWYADPEMARYADSIADENKGLSFKRASALATKRVKEAFPDKFPAKKTETTTRVEGSGRKGPAGKFTEADLTDSQKSIMKQFVKQGIMSKADYIKDIALVAAGGTG